MPAERLVVDSRFLIEAVLPTRQEWQTEALPLINAAAIGDIGLVCPHLQIAACRALKIFVRKSSARSTGHSFPSNP